MKIVQKQQQKQEGVDIYAIEITQTLLIPKVEQLDPSEKGKLHKAPGTWKRQEVKERRNMGNMLQKRSKRKDQHMEDMHSRFSRNPNSENAIADHSSSTATAAKQPRQEL